MPINSEIPNIDNNDLQSLGSILSSSNNSNTNNKLKQQQHPHHQRPQQQPKIVDRKNTFVVKNSGKIIV
jgi:hypothetical protein